MKTSYRKPDESVKPLTPGWTIRWEGYVWHIRARHEDVLIFLRLLDSARRAS